MICFLIGMILGLLLGFILIKKDKEIITVDFPIIDYDYNKNNTDSIYYSIKITDSIINNIKYNYDEIYNLDDSSSIKLFYELVKGK